MSAKENILNRLRQNTRETYHQPDLSTLKPTTFDDPVAEFCKKTTTTAGARLIELPADGDLNAAVRQAYPDAKVVASNLAGIDAQLNPDTVDDVRQLMGVDVGVVEGCIGVAENACIWIPQQMKEKAVCFASQQLVIVLRREAIVSNMHEAYHRLRTAAAHSGTAAFDAYGYGTFISGPSKTADIAQVLVMGAQAARTVTVVLLNA